MGRVLKSTLCLAFSLLLAACVVNPEVQVTIEAIDAIGEIEATDVPQIEEALSLYGALTDSQREQVENYDALARAEAMLPELRHELAVEGDSTAPEIEGMEEDTVIEVTCGTAFDLSAYLSERIVVSDDVTSDGLEYRIDCDDILFDRPPGALNTQISGDYPVTLSAQDEAGNIAELHLTVRLLPIHVTRDDPSPVVYDGEFGTISVSRFSRGWFYGNYCYFIVFDVTNNTNEPMRVCLKSALTVINGTQIGAYYFDNFIPPGVNGKMECEVLISDIPFADGEYGAIESSVCLFVEQDGEDYYYIPIVFDVDAVG